MSVLNVPFGYNWEVRTPIVDRVMHREYVDAFFANGSLRLSSFESFSQHPNEARRDGEEGKAAMKIRTPHADLTAIAFNGQETYVLCGSMVETGPNEEFIALRIKDTIAFAATVARQLPGFIGGTEGPCIYRDNTCYEAGDHREFTPPKEGEEPEVWMRASDKVIGDHMRNRFFIKPSRFSSEAEYRMIWFCEGAPRPYVDIKCPKAIQFCERVSVPVLPEFAAGNEGLTGAGLFCRDAR